MNWKRSGAVAVSGTLGLAALVACSQSTEPSEATASSQQAVYGPNARMWNPQTDPPFRGVGVITVWNDDGSVDGSCSGTLVQRNLVLTAGHCFCDKGEDHRVTFEWPGPDTNGDGVPEPSERIAGQYRWTMDDCGSPYEDDSSRDLGVVILDRNVTEEEVPAPLIYPYIYADFLDTNHTGYWSDLPYIAGYGRNGASFGFPMIWARSDSEVHFDNANWWDPAFGTGSYWMYLRRTNVLTGAPVGAANAPGDSGGPLLFKRAEDSRWFTVGVVSQGVPGPGSAGPTFWEYSRTLFSPTWANGDGNHHWIGQFIKDLDGDGVHDDHDNCPPARCDSQIDCYNPGQADRDGDGLGDGCDNCPFVANADQANSLDSDDVGDACDVCPHAWSTHSTLDQDDDDVGDVCDSCPTTANPYPACDDDTDCSAGSSCIPVDNGIGHCSKQGDDADDDGLGDACDSCPAVTNAHLRMNSNSLAERREVGTEHLPDACDPVPLLGMRPILEQGLLSKIQPDSELPNPGNTVYFRASAQLGEGGYAPTQSASVGFRHCNCVVGGFGPAPLEECVGPLKQCNWAPEEYNSASSKWVPISVAESNRANALGDLAPPLPRNSKLTRTFSSARWFEDRFQYANTDEREAQRLGEPELLAWRFGLDLERTGDPGARVPSYQIDGIEQTWGAVWTYTRGGDFASARDEKRRQRLRDSYTYVHTPSFELSIPYADPTPLNDCGLPNCSPWLDPWYLWPVDPDPFVNPVLLGQLAQPALVLPHGNTSVLLRPDGEALDVGAQLAASGVGELLSREQVAFINPVEDGDTLRRLGDPLQFAAIPSPWEPVSGGVVEVKASSSGLFSRVAERGLQRPPVPPPATEPVPGAPPLAAEEIAPPPVAAIAAPSRRTGALSVLSASERSLFLVGGSADPEETLGDVWRYALDGGTWHRLEFKGARVDTVLSATFDWLNGRLLVLDETGKGWLKRGRLLELNLAARQARVVASWPRLGVYERMYLMPRADGELWVFGSTKLGSTHVFRANVTQRGFRVRGFSQLRGRLKRAPHNAPNGAYLALERRGVPSIEHIDTRTFKETSQCWSGL